MTTAVIVQARLGSTRLPGKVLMRLAGISVLEHVLRRCQDIPDVDCTVCATTTDPSDDAVAGEAARLGCHVFRGSENDVLGRYLDAAEDVGADVVLRVTADCPLIDPGVCADVLRLRKTAGAALAVNNAPRTWPHGLDCEAMTLALLTRAAHEATEPDDREHVTPWMRRQVGTGIANLPMPGSPKSGHRWTLDTATDFAFFTALLDRVPATSGWREILAAVEDDPALAAINV